MNSEINTFINKYVKEKAIDLNGLIKTKVGKRIYGKRDSGSNWNRRTGK